MEEDLRRRDLTINAMAQDGDGELIDPYGGQRDLEAKILRHVSPAFDEDPVRAPEVFVAALASCGAWPAIFPQLPDTAAIEQTLRESAAAKSSLPVRFACLSWHSRDVDAWCQAIRAPRRLAQAARLLHRHFSTWSNLDSDDPSAMLALLESLDAVRRPQQLEDFSAAAAVLSTVLKLDRGQTSQRMQAACVALQGCDEKSAAQQTDQRTVRERVHEARLEAVRNALMESQ